jgi:Ala-tRNA(Pro) deacylase
VQEKPLSDLTQRLIALLEKNEADFRVMHHEPVRTSEEAAQVRGTPLEQGAKALVFHADDRVVLLVLPANRRIDSRAFKRAFGVKNLRMVSAEELFELTGLEQGAVPPFGHLLGLPTFVDERLIELPQISFNAGSRTTSVILAVPDYRRLADATVARFAAE